MDAGLLYIVVAELLWATEIIVIRKYFPNVNSLFLAAIGSVIGSMFYLPVLYASRQKLSVNNWIVVIIYALTSWFLAQIFYVSGIQKSTNSVGVTLATLTLPLSTFLLSYFFLQETLTWKLAIGGAIMVVGFLIVSL